MGKHSQVEWKALRAEGDAGLRGTSQLLHRRGRPGATWAETGTLSAPGERRGRGRPRKQQASDPPRGKTATCSETVGSPFLFLQKLVPPQLCHLGHETQKPPSPPQGKRAPPFSTLQARKSFGAPGPEAPDKETKPEGYPQRHPLQAQKQNALAHCRWKAAGVWIKNSPDFRFKGAPFLSTESASW